MKNRCEFCRNYQMIDSAFGKCIINPPIPKYGFLVNRRFPFIHFGITDFIYPEVEWNCVVCSNYIDKRLCQTI
jgi:hypothetical protein